MEIVESFASAVEKRACIVCQPERRKYVERSFAGCRREVGLSDQHRNIRRQAIVTPNLHDVANQLRFVVKTAPRNAAWIVGAMLKRKETQTVHTPFCLHTLNEPPVPYNHARFV